MAQAQERYPLEEIHRRALELYERDIRDRVMPEQKGKFLVVDIESGDYEVDASDVRAEQTLRSRRPDGVFFMLRVGYAAAHKMSGRMRLQNLMP